ncbi:alpha/beta fold hydrolase [Mucilaginibacter sp. OK098]|uniref:alpha/beta fold hydrolase n=1 Tax=Mucilaginibacter sp. OK098 TaxID=1855297 RepID=UPI00091FE828|nr:alpha/beta hydrolase [Mucilaginibacter sp. OK098]SHM10689.1 Pimeloyl-ACP methyl ester carboxylesterase [Mucilaginibacter sp. OK098]
MFKKVFICFLVFLYSNRCTAQSNDFSYHWESINGVKIFYRTAGNPGNPVIVLLHGFPSSSVMYQGLMQLLKIDFFLIAPDYPGHGYSDVPSSENYPFTFDNISNSIDLLLNQLKIHKYSLFMQDYGAPVGFRLALKHPENITALIIQNGNAYMDGFPEAQDPNGELQQYWRDKNKKYETDWINYYRKASSVLPGQWNFSTAVNPDRHILDADIMLKPGRLELFMQLWFDYGNNVKSYPLWHQYLKKYQPPVLITWGKEDTFFTVPGALAYLKDVPKAEIHLLNGGHWAATENNTAEIAELILSFFKRNSIN